MTWHVTTAVQSTLAVITSYFSSFVLELLQSHKEYNPHLLLILIAEALICWGLFQRFIKQQLRSEHAFIMLLEGPRAVPSTELLKSFGGGGSVEARQAMAAAWYKVVMSMLNFVSRMGVFLFCQIALGIVRDNWKDGKNFLHGFPFADHTLKGYPNGPEAATGIYAALIVGFAGLQKAASFGL